MRLLGKPFLWWDGTRGHSSGADLANPWPLPGVEVKGGFSSRDRSHAQARRAEHGENPPFDLDEDGGRLKKKAI